MSIWVHAKRIEVRTIGLAAAAAFALGGCLGTEGVVNAAEDAAEAIAEQREFLDENPGAESAAGSFAYDADAGTITMTIGDGGSTCASLPQPGDEIAFSVDHLSAERLVLTDRDDPEFVLDMTRVGGGTEIYGSWRADFSDTESLLLSLLEDGSAVLTFAGFACDGGDEVQAYDNDGRPLNAYNCGVTSIPEFDWDADAMASEWAQQALLAEDNDSDGAANTPNGAELTAIWVAQDADGLGLAFQSMGEVNRNFANQATAETLEGRTRYVIELARDGGDVEQIELGYDWFASEFSGDWVLGGDVAAVTDSVNSYAASDGPFLEVRLDWDDLGNPAALGHIRLQTSSCDGDGNCTIYDQTTCLASESLLSEP